MIAIGFLIAFPAGAIVRALVSAPRIVAYPIAGAAAIAAVLGGMHAMFDATPIGGARGALGFSAQVLCGLLGGVVFALGVQPSED